MESSSLMLKELPISRRFKELPISRKPEKDTVPFKRTLSAASVVCACQVRTSSRSEDGTRSRQRDFPSGEAAWDSSYVMIFVYSKVFKAFWFIFIGSSRYCIRFTQQTCAYARGLFR